jgi:hypothetical protein
VDDEMCRYSVSSGWRWKSYRVDINCLVSMISIERLDRFSWTFTTDSGTQDKEHLEYQVLWEGLHMLTSSVAALNNTTLYAPAWSSWFMNGILFFFKAEHHDPWVLV